MPAKIAANVFWGQFDVRNIKIALQTIFICIRIRWGQEIFSQVNFIKIQDGRRKCRSWSKLHKNVGDKMKITLMKRFWLFSLDEES